MRSSLLASRLDSLVCPFCEASKLYSSVRDSMYCGSCGGRLSGAMLETLWCISALPDALGMHACECGYPEMRRLPDGTYHCPACGSEVLPINAPSALSKPDEHGEAFWAGWVDGHFGVTGSFVDNPNVARWKDPSDRLDYYRGHRAGSEARLAERGRSSNPDEAARAWPVERSSRSIGNGRANQVEDNSLGAAATPSRWST